MEFLTGADRSKSAPAMRKTVASNAPDKSSSGSANSPGVRPPRATSSAILATVEENNYGITWDDHHDANGASPPAKHKALYDFLPRVKFQVKDDDDMRAESVQMIREAKREAANKQIPKSIVVEMSHSDDPLSTQRLQARVMGVYNLIRASVEKAKPPAPVWKHAREDLVLLQGDVDGEKGWIIALSTSLHNDSKPKVCARVHGAELPHVGSGKQQRIQAWDPYKGKWLWVNDVKLRPTYHGWATSPLISYMSNFDSIIQTNVKDDVQNGGARLRSPTNMRSVLEKPKDGKPLPHASALMNDYKAKYASPYSAKSTSVRIY